MRVVVIGATGCVGYRTVERLRDRGDDVLAVHRGRDRPPAGPAVEHLLCDRTDLAAHDAALRRFRPDAVVDACAMTGRDVDALPDTLRTIRSVVLSSQDVYAAYAGFREQRDAAPVPIAEDGPLRETRYAYRGLDLDGIPDDYEKLDVEERWLAHDATVLRLPMVYGPRDRQRREHPILDRLRAGRTAIPIGTANLLWSRSHVDDIATGILAALETPATGRAINLGDPHVRTIGWWLQQIIDATGRPAQLVRVPDHAVPPDLAITAASPQHLLVSVDLAQRLLDWHPQPPEQRVAESVGWHLAHPPGAPSWTGEHAAADDDALAQRLDRATTATRREHTARR